MIFKSFNDIVISMIDYLRLVQNDLDTKPGTVSRDLFIDSPAQQMAEIYSQIRNIANLSSLFSSNGSDLNNLASNFNVSRNPGSSSIGVAIFTTNILDTDIIIASGSVVVANNGVSFQVVNTAVMKATSSNVYKSTATRFKTELNLAGITDTYAIEVNVESLTTGSSGNIGPYSISSQNVSGVSNVTNLQSFSGGSNPESDDAFRTRILSVFAGSNTGTSLGYTTTIESLSGVEDSVIVLPGDTLLIRDGTQVVTDSDGNSTITSIGTGGKVDIYVLGNVLSSRIDSFIYNDKSGNHDSTDPINDFILGQQGQSTSTNVSQRRIDLISSEQLPFQPVDGVVSVVGSSSGSNFIEKYTDGSGLTHGNFQLLKDTGDFGGSPFGFDRLRWVSSLIELEGEEATKGIFNGTDQMQFSDIEEIKSITQDVLVISESVFVNSSSRSSVTLKHTPIRNVNRVVNLTTGERYIVSNQNPNGEADALNTTGSITISGNTLPSATDVLQIDYVWVKSFDRVFDFDNLIDHNATRFAQDSVDWGFGNLVQNEQTTIVSDVGGSLNVTVVNPIYSVLSVLVFHNYTSVVSDGTVSVAPGDVVTNVLDIRRASDNAELFNTDSRQEGLNGTNVISLPLDSIANDGDVATIRFNYSDIFSSDAYGTGHFSDNTIYFSENVASEGDVVLVNYIASVSNLIPENNISLLPAVSSENKFMLDGVLLGYQPTSNVYSGTTITNNLRKAGSNLKISVGSTRSSGALSVLGTTIHLVSDALVSITSSDGFEVDLSNAIMDDANISAITSSIKVAKIYSVEKVHIDSSNNVISVDNVFDVVNYKINDNSGDINIALTDTLLSKTKIALPRTPDNIINQLNTGDLIRITFYYINNNDNESIYFSKNGEQITSKIFTNVSRIYVNSGFKDISNNLTGVFSVSNFNQPLDNTTYVLNYNYVAPKENERITITFNYNSIINTSTLAIEQVRPITADILVKAAKEKSINVSVRIVLLPEFSDQEQTVVQNAIDSVSSFFTSTSLGTTIDASDVINTLYSVQGIDRVRVLNFSSDNGNNTLSITALKNEYLSAGTIDIQSETR